MKNNKKAGTVTLAVGMIFIGSVLLISNFYNTGIEVLLSFFKYWPVLLIGLGVEYFIRSYFNSKNNETGEGTKFHLPTVITILLIAFTGFIGQQAAGLFKNQDLNMLITEAIAGDRYSYLSEFESKTINVKSGVTTVNLESLSGRVHLIPSTDGKFRVQAGITGWGPSETEARRRAEMYRIDVKEGDVVSVYGSQSQVRNSQRPVEVTYRIMIPKGINVYVENNTGQVKGDNLEANIKIKTQFAEVSLRNIKGKISFEGDNGRADFEAINGSLDTRLSSGKIFIKDVQKEIHAESDNSDIEISSSKPVNAKYLINNYNGFIVLKLPETSDTVVTAKTETGEIRGSLNLKHEAVKINPGQQNWEQPASEQSASDRPTKSQTVPGEKATTTLGHGKGLINLTTVSGNIVIDKY